ncbi:hypothetical protein GCM10027157_10750 [Corynebacterium aquatimens]
MFKGIADKASPSHALQLEFSFTTTNTAKVSTNGIARRLVSPLIPTRVPAAIHRLSSTAIKAQTRNAWNIASGNAMLCTIAIGAPMTRTAEAVASSEFAPSLRASVITPAEITTVKKKFGTIAENPYGNPVR